MKKIFVILFSCFFALSLAAHESCIPENNLWIAPDAKGVTMTQAEFNKDIDNIEDLYKPIVKEEYGKTLKVVRNWEDGTVNAYATQKGSVWEVHMFGGLARHKATTDDGFMAVICHELGHHIGGAPKIASWYGTSWASNEGQSDYFATTKCLKKFFEQDIKKTIKVYREASASQALIAKQKCDEVYNEEANAAICYRSAMAGKSLATLLGSLRSAKAPRFDTPDTKVVTKTYDKHPEAQCRLDTYFQGALCDQDHMLLPSMTEASVGYCMRSNGYEVGIRPLCWYRPE